MPTLNGLLEQKRKALTRTGSAQGILVITAERSQTLMFPVWLLSVIEKGRTVPLKFYLICLGNREGSL